MVSRRNFLYLTSSLGLYLLSKGCSRPAAVTTFSDLTQLGSRYTFALIADPQVSEATTEAPGGLTTQRKLSEIIQEINGNPSVSFVVFNGDMVQRGIPAHIDNFMNRAETLKPLSILVHGNHDGSYPYTELRDMQQRLNGTEQAQFGFDVGNWHYVTFPCNLGQERANELELLEQLDADLSAHRDRPVMVLEHLHLMPQGLTPLLWYTYNRDFRNEILDVLTRYGNVRHVINGHVHNGIKASVKTAWTYQDIKFITAPTCLVSRNFGEEYPEFQKGMRQSQEDLGGGYYLLIDVDGDEIRIRGRLVGVRDEFIYPDSFTEYRDQEPIWFKPLTAYPAHATFLNSSFETGFEGWKQSYRYMADEEPAYISETVSVTERPGQVAHLFVREKGRAYAHEEIRDIYQLIRVPTDRRSLVFNANYRIEPEQLTEGGGFISLVTYHANQPELLILFDWSQTPRVRNKHLGQHLHLVGMGQRAKSNKLSDLGQQKKAMFFDLPLSDTQWHSVQIDVNRAYQQALGDPQAADLSIDTVLVIAGVWCGPRKGAKSGAFFDDFAISFNSSTNAVQVDNQIFPVTDHVFQTDLGVRQTKQ